MPEGSLSVHIPMPIKHVPNSAAWYNRIVAGYIYAGFRQNFLRCCIWNLSEIGAVCILPVCKRTSYKRNPSRNVETILFLFPLDKLTRSRSVKAVRPFSFTASLVEAVLL